MREIEATTEEELKTLVDELEALITKHPEEQIIKFFRFDHLKNMGLKFMSASYAEMAYGILGTIPRSAERTVALRKLLESKDAAVRACL